MSVLTLEKFSIFNDKKIEKNFEYIPLRDPLEVADLPIRLGTHLRKLDDIKKLENLPINIIEIKPEQFSSSEKLFLWNKDTKRFEKNERNLEKLFEFIKKKKIFLQVHLPDKFDAKDKSYINLSPGENQDHKILFQCFELLEDIRRECNPSNELIVTVHPPYSILKYKFKEILEKYKLENIENHLEIPLEKKKEIEKEFLLNANKFFIELGNMIQDKGWNIKIGVENQAHSSKDSWNVGNKISDFEILMQNTPDSIQLTFDTGHSLLSRDEQEEKILRFREFTEFAKTYKKYLVNYHFHENDSWTNDPEKQSYKADLHRPPTDKIIPGFKNYHLFRCVNEKVPATLEISLSKIKPPELLLLTTELKKDLEKLSTKANL
ncbi:sugar phosphate isomerase/epimerase [Candidatus Kuenenbacteria bacterium]|nr:sugar phosphate isomerase/epimerase [Candidatus Kuenenbacteria bacterium]